MIVFPFSSPLNNTVLYQCLITIDNIVASFPDVSSYNDSLNWSGNESHTLYNEIYAITRDERAALEVRKSLYSAIKRGDIIRLSEYIEKNKVSLSNIFPLLQFKSRFGYFNLAVVQYFFKNSQELVFFIQLPDFQWVEAIFPCDKYDAYECDEKGIHFKVFKPEDCIIFWYLVFPTQYYELGQITFIDENYNLLARPVINFMGQQDDFDPSGLEIVMYEGKPTYGFLMPQNIRLNIRLSTQMVPLLSKSVESSFSKIFSDKKHRRMSYSEREVDKFTRSIFDDVKKCLEHPEKISDFWDVLDRTANIIEVVSAFGGIGLWLIKLIHDKRRKELSSENVLITHYYEMIDSIVSFFRETPKARLEEISQGTRLPKSILKHLLKGLSFEHEPACFWQPPSIDDKVFAYMASRFQKNENIRPTRASSGRSLRSRR